jgi:tetratricopeptide (TPR) repeat protein
MDPALISSFPLIDRKRGLSEKAISLLKRSIELDPNLGEAYSLLASLHADADRVQEAAMLHLKALQVSPRNADFINNYAVFLQSRGMCVPSISHFLSSFFLSPSSLNDDPPPILLLLVVIMHLSCVISLPAYLVISSRSLFLFFERRTDILFLQCLCSQKRKFIPSLIPAHPFEADERHTNEKSRKSSLTIYLPHAITCPLPAPDTHIHVHVYFTLQTILESNFAPSRLLLSLISQATPKSQ